MYSYLYVSKEPTPRCLLSWCNCKRTQWKSGPLKQLSINRRQENVDYVINFLFLINKQKNSTFYFGQVIGDITQCAPRRAPRTCC